MADGPEAAEAKAVERRKRKAEAERRRRARFTPEQKAASRQAWEAWSARQSPEDIERRRVENLVRLAKKRGADPAYCEKLRQRCAEWRKAHPLKARLLDWNRRGILLDAAGYSDLLAKQGGVCRICALPNKGKGLAVDHCHTTGRVRGLLCDPCNRSIGVLGDTPEALERVVRYLRGSL